MQGPGRDFAGYRAVDDDGRAARHWWDANAEDYLDEHGVALGVSDFRWCPEGLREEEARLLGDVTGRRVLEVGAGAAQCTRWLRARGVDAVASDLSAGMLAAARRLDEVAGTRTPLLQADARRLPLPDGTLDVVFTAYGALPFVPDARALHREAARVLRPGGRWVFAVTHPVRWAFPDDPGERGLTATRSYFDRTPYVETDEHGTVTYAEYHRTVGDHVRDLVAAGLHLVDLVEPEWPAGNTRTWGGWSPLRGARIPGTAVFVTRKER
ncbi:MAG: class I SAM-dependent methyltransferase [Actinotalea sp.]|nr:class I SAM-dependent methyltransferase [Actinotalea sp.]